jgi:putative acetyltransferase
MISLRAANSNDFPAIHEVVRQAFGRDDEAQLVESLRAEDVVLLELVAEEDDAVVGHVLFSALPLISSEKMVHAAALAPMSVHPQYQRRGIGGALIHMGQAMLTHQGVEAVIVLGHPDYYTRYGFSPELASNLDHPFPPGPHFMARELEPGALDGPRLSTCYPRAFGLQA